MGKWDQWVDISLNSLNIQIGWNILALNELGDALKFSEAFDFLDQVKEFFEIDDVFGGSVCRLFEFENQLMSGGHAPPDGGGRIKRMKHDRGSVV